MNRTAFSLGLMVMAVASTLDAREPLTGTWKRGTDESAGGELRTVEAEGDLKFQLWLWAGPPADSSGFAKGHMAIHEGKAVFETTEFGRRCRIEFAFTPKRIVIKQTRGDSVACGFGHNIEATGRFVRASRETPQFDNGF